MSGGRYSTVSPWFNCSDKFGCPTPILFKTTIISVNRNGKLERIVIKQPTTPYWQCQSENIRNSTYFTAGQTFAYGNNTLNEFGSWSGAPRGYGMPPKNTF